jgi:hypothetical protein
MTALVLSYAEMVGPVAGPEGDSGGSQTVA